MVGQSDEVQVQTRWKERAGEPRIVEVSHLSHAARALEEAPEDAAAVEEASED